jgi:hypothetical protein
MGGLQHPFRRPVVEPAPRLAVDRRGREQILRDAGAALSAAIERQEIYEAGLKAATALVADLPAAQIELLIGAARSMTVVLAAGVAVRDPVGATIAEIDLPGPVRAGLLEGRVVRLSRVDRPILERLRFDPGATSLTVVPLVIGYESSGALAVAATGTLAAACALALEALAAQLALALAGLARREERTNSPAAMDPLPIVGVVRPHPLAAPSGGWPAPDPDPVASPQTVLAAGAPLPAAGTESYCASCRARRPIKGMRLYSVGSQTMAQGVCPVCSSMLLHVITR